MWGCREQGELPTLPRWGSLDSCGAWASHSPPLDLLQGKCSWVPPNGSNDGMTWDGMRFPSSLCKGSPHWQPFWSSQLLLHASFSLSSRNLFQNSADLFCFRSYWFCLLGYCPYPSWMVPVTCQVLLMLLDRRQSQCLLLAPPSPCRTLDTPFYDDDVSVENYHLSWTAKEGGSLLQWKKFIIIDNRLSNCMQSFPPEDLGTPEKRNFLVSLQRGVSWWFIMNEPSCS